MSIHEKFNTYPRLAVVIPTYNRWVKAKATISSLLMSDYKNYEIILIEDGCTDGTEENCRSEFPQVQLLSGDGNLWWSGAINKGVEYALNDDVDLILWLNDDTSVESQTLTRMVEAFQRAGDRSIICGRVKSVFTGNDEWVGGPPVWHPEFDVWTPPDLSRPVIPLTYPPGGRGVLIPSGCFREIGEICSRVFPQYWADHDFHYRAMKAGYQYFLATEAVIWNVPWVEPVGAPRKFSLRWAIPYLFSRRSPMNILTIRRLLKRHFSSAQYREIYFSWLRRILMWIITGWIARRPLVYRTLRAVGRIVLRGRRKNEKRFSFRHYTNI
jgi:GT2 family glycosyltransferase